MFFCVFSNNAQDSKSLYLVQPKRGSSGPEKTVRQQVPPFLAQNHNSAIPSRSDASGLATDDLTKEETD